jgi:hypothetical protein
MGKMELMIEERWITGSCPVDRLHRQERLCHWERLRNGEWELLIGYQQTVSAR